jgi:hypothetical protein
MADHCCICSDMRSSFGHLERADLVLVGERLGVFILPMLRMNRNTHSELIAPECGLLSKTAGLGDSLINVG